MTNNHLIPQNILITGSYGQLGKSIHSRSQSPEFDFNHYYFCDVDTLDITDKEAVNNFVTYNNINTIINCAAYTNVDKAETEIENAYKLNETGVDVLAKVAFDHQILLIHISTDYVFDGTKSGKYSIEDIPNPVSIYGKSKLAGEKAILASGCRSVIVRTSWLYSPFGHNFVKTMLRIGSEKAEVKVVSDQVGAPTYAIDLADILLKIANHHTHLSGSHLYHFANEGVTSWYEFAKSIMELSHLPCKVIPIKSKDYPTTTARPANSVFDLSKIKHDYHHEIPEWETALKSCLEWE